MPDGRTLLPSRVFEANPVADNATAAGKAQNRRVEVYLYASQAMIEAANNGTLE